MRRERLAERRLDGRGGRPAASSSPIASVRPRAVMGCAPLRASKSAMMPSHSATSTRKKCAFSLVSIRGTPLPGSVRSTIALGRPLPRAGGAQGADVIAAMSLPSISAVSQPKARHLSATGSMSSTTGPSAWMPLQSTSATRPSRPKCAGGHRRLPGRAFLHLAVGELDEDARLRAVEAQAERLPDALAEAVAERAADHLDARAWCRASTSRAGCRRRRRWRAPSIGRIPASASAAQSAIE